VLLTRTIFPFSRVGRRDGRPKLIRERRRKSRRRRIFPAAASAMETAACGIPKK
jgi:hypothetical protein